MADYFGTLFLSKLPFCMERQEMVNGVEKTCLVIPCDEAQMFRASGGGWAIRLKVTELPPNPQLKSHRLRLGYRNYDEVNKAERMGYYRDCNRLGYMLVRNPAPELKKDYTNNMTEIHCKGKIFVDSIQREDIKTDPETGRRYVDFEFRKTPKIDIFGNSHEAVVKTRYGEHQIALATEIKDAKQAVTPPPEKDKTTYEGYIF